jgi:hypothetical protein
MAKFPFFLIFLFTSMFAMIGVALFPLVPKKHTLIEAPQKNGSFVFDRQALNHIQPTKSFFVTPSPGPRGDQKGTRLASFSVLAPGSSATKGARLNFGPKTRAALQKQGLTLVMSARSLDMTPSTSVAVGLDRGGPIRWVQASVNANLATLRFDFPASGDPASGDLKQNQLPIGLAIWPSVAGNGLGIEVQSMSLTPLQTQALQVQP